MGNITSVDYSSSVRDIRVETGNDIIDAAFLCEQDYYDDGGARFDKINSQMYYNKKFPVVKKNLREFIKTIYGGDDSTIFRWSTWDVKNADIISSHVNASTVKNKFDVICSIGCPVINFKQEDVNSICRLLKPDGILVFYTRIGMDKKSFMQRSIEFQNPQLIIPNCLDVPFVPISRVGIPNLHGSSEITLEMWKRVG